MPRKIIVSLKLADIGTICLLNPYLEGVGIVEAQFLFSAIVIPS
jgi:hypothetical protein